MWDVGYVWSALLPQVWLVQGEYFNMSLRRDKAINCYRRALCLAEKEGFIYARGKVIASHPTHRLCPLTFSLQCHWVLGLTIADPAEAMLHLQKAVPIFESAGAGWEKAAVQEDLRKAEQALMSTIMF